jgi:hypothetical protein
MFNVCPFCNKNIELIRDYPSKVFVFRRHYIVEGAECPGVGYSLNEARYKKQLKAAAKAELPAYTRSRAKKVK